MTRYEVRRRVLARDLRRPRRPRSEVAADGIWDLLIFGPVVVAVWHGIAFVFEAVVVGLVTAGQVVVRVATRRPWPVEARFRTNGAVARRWEVRGFRAAGLVAAQLQAAADRGDALPPAGRRTPRG